MSLGTETRQIAVMVGWIGLIHFVVEAGIMGWFSGWNLTHPVIVEGLLDSTMLTVFSGPPIYWWVAKPFIVSAHNAEAALAKEVQVQATQAHQLEVALDNLQHTLDQNEELRNKLQHANEQTADVNERALQRIGADLHDGPTQLLTYSLLRLGKFAPVIESAIGANGKEELELMKVALTDTLTELRNLSLGLSLPQLDDATLEETIAKSVALHQEQTGSIVQTVVTELPAHVPQAVKVCVYRVVQESLTNAYRHGNAKGQKVACSYDDVLVLAISDQGPGFDIQAYNKDGLGLNGMRSRVEALGGSLVIDTGRDRGTRILALIDIENLLRRETAHV